MDGIAPASKLEVSPNPALPIGHCRAGDLTPVLGTAASHELNLAANTQYADDVSITAPNIVDIYILANYCCGSNA
jgi:hypothetical protein